MSEPITGKNAQLTLDNASGAPTDISDYVTSVTPASDTEEFTIKTFKAQRASKIAGFQEEDWDVKGPWTPEAETFWRALAGVAAGRGIDYALVPDIAGTVAWEGTCNVNHYEVDDVSAEAPVTYTARLSILTKTTGVFSA